MKNRIIVVAFIALAVILGGCSTQGSPSPSETQAPGVIDNQSNSQPTIEPGPNETAKGSDTETGDIDTFARLFPDKEGYKWVYNGFAEYGHDLKLEEIVNSEDKVVYKSKGEVFDMSDGESKNDYDLTVEYIITPDAVLQTKVGKMMMDTFDQMELVRGPLEEGKTWIQTVKDADGREVKLNCTIEKIDEDSGTKVYHVVYRAEEGPYYESRVIKEGVGVVAYTKLFMTENGNYEISYFLYEDASGYNK